MYSKSKKTWVIILVFVLILAGISTIIALGGSNRKDPGEVTEKINKKYGEEENFYIDNDGEFQISNGILYAAARRSQNGYGVQGHIIAIDIDSDELIWNHSHHGPPKRTVWISSIFVSNDMVYSGDQHGNVVAADVETGEKIWRNSLHEGNYTTRINSLFVSDRTVYTASRNGTVAAADAETGERIWMHRYHNDSVMSVHAEDGTVYSVSGDGNVTAVSAKGGERIWTHQLHDDWVYSVYVHDKVVYSGDRDGKLIAYDAVDKKKLWSHTHHGDVPYHDDSVLSIHVNDGVVYSGSADVSVVAASSENGEKLWRHRYHDASNGFSYEGVRSIQYVDGEIYSLHDAGCLISVEKEGSLTLGILRLLADVRATFMSYFRIVVLTIAIGIAIISTFIIKSRGWDENVWKRFR